jgi:hypothetical protein
MHGCQIFLKIQNLGAIAWPQKEKIGCHMYQITQREPPEEQDFDARLNLSKKKYWCHFFYHPHILVATQHTIFKKLKKHCLQTWFSSSNVIFPLKKIPFFRNCPSKQNVAIETKILHEV